jgi:hypothetical protein
VVLATIPWGPPAERRLTPVATSSLLSAGPALARAAATAIRTLPDGAVCIAEPDATGAISLIRVEAGERTPTVTAAIPPGAQLIDFLGLADGTWVLLETLPGPPDQVRVRAIAADGSARWSHGSTPGTPDALAGLLCDARGARFGVSGVSPRRLVTLDADTGAARGAQPIGDALGAYFMNGAGRVGYLAADGAEAAETAEVVDGAETAEVADGTDDGPVRVWVSLDAREGRRRGVRLHQTSGMESAIGMDAEDRSYWNRFATLLRRNRSGQVDWELEVAQAVVDGDRVWIQQRPEGGRELIALALSADPQAGAAPVTLRLPEDEPDRAWHLAGREPDDIFVLHGTTGANDPGVLARIDARDGRVVDLRPAGQSVWLQWFDLQRPSRAAVTDAGELDIATRGPDGLSVIRITPR